MMSKYKVQNHAIAALSCLLILSLALSTYPIPQYYDLAPSFHFDVYVSIKKAGSTLWVPLVVKKHNVVTNIGLDKIELELGDAGTTDEANYISLTESATSPSASWTILPSEIASGGLTRALGTYDSTGTGAWRIQKTFTASASFTVRTAGLNWASSGDNNLLAAVAFGTVATLASGDTLNVTWTCSVT